MTDALGSERGTLQTEGGPLYYEVAGNGPAVVLIHAGIADHTMWDDQWEEFAREFRVVRYDTRGFGGSPVEEEGHSFSNRQDLYELLRHLGIERTHVIGVSRGGQIGTDFTLEHPEMVASLVTVSAGLGGMDDVMPTPEEIALFEEMDKAWEAKDWERLADLDVRVWADGPGQPEGRADARVREKIREMCLRNYRNHPFEGAPIVLDPPPAGRLDEIKVPALVVVGDLDGKPVLQTADRLTEGIAGAGKVVFEGAAHVPSMEQPERFNRVVLDFLREVSEQ